MTTPKNKAISWATTGVFLLAVWLAWPLPGLMAQSSQTPTTESAPPAEASTTTPSAKEEPSSTPEEKPDPERSRAYRRHPTLLAMPLSQSVVHLESIHPPQVIGW